MSPVLYVLGREWKLYVFCHVMFWEFVYNRWPAESCSTFVAHHLVLPVDGRTVWAENTRTHANLNTKGSCSVLRCGHSDNHSVERYCWQSCGPNLLYTQGMIQADYNKQHWHKHWPTFGLPSVSGFPRLGKFPSENISWMFNTLNATIDINSLEIALLWPGWF
jgi:hypothetical protein